MLQDLLHKITAFISVVIMTITSLLPYTAINTNQLTDISIASPSATISTSPAPSPTIKPKPRVIYTQKPTPIPTPTPSPQPSRISVLLVNDGTTVYCLSEWADEVKRASQAVKDAEETVNKFSDCNNSCSKSFETASNDCNAKYPNLAKCISLFSSFPKDSSWADCISQYPALANGSIPPEYKTCANKAVSEKAACLSSCPRPSSGGDSIEMLLGSIKSKKFLQETKGEHCIDSK